MNPFDLKNQVFLQFSEIFFCFFFFSYSSIDSFSPSRTPIIPTPGLLDKVSRVSYFNLSFPFLFMIILGCEAFVLFDLLNH